MKTLFLISTIIISLSSFAQTPSFEWAKDWNAACFSFGNVSMRVHKSGNVYTTGTFRGTEDFDPGSGVFNLSTAIGSPSDSSDAFVLKLDASGNLVWAISFGAKMVDYGYSLALDEDENVYTVGTFKGTVDMDPGAGVYNLSSAGEQAMYIHKMDKNGNFTWARKVDGYGLARLIHISTDGFIYLSGNSGDTVDFDPGAGVFKLGAGSYVLKLDRDGNFIHALQAGNQNNALLTATTASENLIISGVLSGASDFDPDTSNYVISSRCSYIAQYSDSGKFEWAKIFELNPGSGLNIRSLGTDSFKNIFIAGNFYGSVDFNPGTDTFFMNASKYGDAFITKLDSNGNFIWARQVGGPLSEFRISVYIDRLGNSYTAGEYQERGDFDPDPLSTYTLYNYGEIDIFMLKLDPEGKFIWAEHVGGPRSDYENNIQVGADGCIYNSGVYIGEIYFDTTGIPGSILYDPLANGQLFIHKMNLKPTAVTDVLSENKINVYPNPSGGDFIIDFGTLNYRNYQVVVYNSVGQEIFNQKEISDNTIHLSNQVPGLYFLKIIKDTEFIYSQMIDKN